MCVSVRACVFNFIVIYLQTIYDAASDAVSGPIDYVYTNVDFSKITVKINGTEVSVGVLVVNTNS